MRRRLTSLAGCAAAVLAALAPAAMLAAAVAPAAAADDTPAAAVEVTGAHLYLDHGRASGQVFVRAVFRTRDALPRRFDGAISGGAAIAGVNRSIASVGGRGTSCYTAATEVRGGTIAAVGAGRQVSRQAALVGRAFTVALVPRDGEPAVRTLTLRAERRGDDAGRRLGC